MSCAAVRFLVAVRNLRVGTEQPTGHQTGKSETVLFAVCILVAYVSCGSRKPARGSGTAEGRAKIKTYIGML